MLERASSEQPVHVPALVAGLGILAIASTEEPEALASLVLDHEVIAHGPEFFLAANPFTENALGPVRAFDPASLSAPGELHRWVVGQQRHRFNEFRVRQQARRAWPVDLPPQLGCLGERGNAGNGPLRDLALDGGKAVEPILANAIAQRVDQFADVPDRRFSKR